MAEVSKLSADWQDAMAALIIDELDDAARWDQAFGDSLDALAQLAAEALADEQAGKTEEPDRDKL